MLLKLRKSKTPTERAKHRAGTVDKTAFLYFADVLIRRDGGLLFLMALFRRASVGTIGLNYS